MESQDPSIAAAFAAAGLVTVLPSGSENSVNALRAAGLGVCAATGWLVCLPCCVAISAGDKLPDAEVVRAHLRSGPHKAKANGSGDGGDSSRALGKALVYHGEQVNSGLLASLSAIERKRRTQYLRASPLSPHPRLRWARMSQYYLCRLCCTGFETRPALSTHLKKLHEASRDGTEVPTLSQRLTSAHRGPLILAVGEKRPEIDPAVACLEANMGKDVLKAVEVFRDAKRASFGSGGANVQRRDELSVFAAKTGLGALFRQLESTGLTPAVAVRLTSGRLGQHMVDAVERGISAGVRKLFHSAIDAYYLADEQVRQGCKWRWGQLGSNLGAAALCIPQTDKTRMAYARILSQLIVFAVRLVRLASGEDVDGHRDLGAVAGALVGRLHDGGLLDRVRRAIRCCREERAVELDATLLDVSLHILTRPYDVSKDVHAVRLFFTLCLVDEKYGKYSFTVYGDALSTSAAALQMAGAITCALYIARGCDTDTGTQRFEEVSTMRHSLAPGLTIGAFLANVVSTSKAVSQSKASAVRFERCLVPEHGLCGMVDGRCLPVGLLGGMVDKALAGFYAVLPALLSGDGEGVAGKCIGAETLARLSQVPSHPDADRLSLHGPGIWFGGVTMKEKALTAEARDMASTFAAAQFAMQGPVLGGEESWEAGKLSLTADGRRAAVAWTTLLHRALGHLLAAVHMSAGGPMRATEYSHLTVYDGERGRVRDFYVDSQRLWLIPAYAKNCGQGVKRLEAREILPNVASAVVAWTKLVLPMRTLLVRVCGFDVDGCRTDAGCGASLFAPDGHKDNSAPDVGRWLNTGLKAAGLPFTVKSYRHYHTGVAQLVAQGHGQLARHGGETAADAGTLSAATLAHAKRIGEALMQQAGHSLAVADDFYAASDVRHSYGAEAVAVSNLSLALPREASRTWAALIYSVPSGADAGVSGPAIRLLPSVPPRPLPPPPHSPPRQSMPPPPAKHAAVDEEMLLAALRQCVGKAEVSWRTDLQKQATLHSARRGSGDALVVAATGLGKTSLTLVPAILERELPLVTLVLVPLVAATDDLLGRAKACGVRAARLRDLPRSDWSSVAAHLDVVYVSLEDVASGAHGALFLSLLSKKQVARIVIEEAHILWLSRFRASAQVVANGVREVPTAFVDGGSMPAIIAVTATCPPTAEARTAVLGACGMTAAGTTEFRQPSTVRRNIRQRIALADDDAEIPALIYNAIYAATSGKDAARVIVFVGNVADVAPCRDAVHALYGADMGTMLASVAFHRDGLWEVLAYHGQLTAAAKQRVLDQWLAPFRHGCRVVVSTNCFGVGVDVDNVRLVVHVGGAAVTLVDFAQERGRAGRDGELACSLVIRSRFTGGRTPDWKAAEAPAGSGDFRAWVMCTDGTCRNVAMHAVLDGEANSALAACQRGGVAACDVCCEAVVVADAAGMEAETVGAVAADTDVESGGAVPAVLGAAVALHADLEAEMATADEEMDVMAAASALLPAPTAATPGSVEAGAMTAEARATITPTQVAITLRDKGLAQANMRTKFEEIVQAVAPAATFCGLCEVWSPWAKPHGAAIACGSHVCSVCFSGEHRQARCPQGAALVRVNSGMCTFCGFGLVLGRGHKFGAACMFRSAVRLACTLFWRGHSSLVHHIPSLPHAAAQHFFQYWTWIHQGDRNGEPNLGKILRLYSEGRVDIASEVPALRTKRKASASGLSGFSIARSRKTYGYK